MIQQRRVKECGLVTSSAQYASCRLRLQVLRDYHRGILGALPSMLWQRLPSILNSNGPVWSGAVDGS